MKKLKHIFMKFGNIFKDDNDINEKSVVGFAAFAVMVIFAAADIITGFVGKDLVIQEFIYDSFLFITFILTDPKAIEVLFLRFDLFHIVRILESHNNQFDPHN